jgi:putative DNA primase/helicase
MDAGRLALALGGRLAGEGWVARCPAHDDHTPSLAIRGTDEGNILVYCHAGCDQDQVIQALRDRALWPSSAGRRAARRVRHNFPAVRRAPSDCALSIWQACAPAAGTPIETYLRARGIEARPCPRIRFHGALRHPAGSTWPAAVALVTQGLDDSALAIHRTFLVRDGSGKAPVEPAKMMLGPCRGGAVRLDGIEPPPRLMVGEGIETCLAAMQATGLPAWAALSTSGMRGLELPHAVRDVIVLADGDGPGEAAARECAQRWNRQGRRVRIAHAPAGLDFNDVLLGRAPLQRAFAP